MLTRRRDITKLDEEDEEEDKEIEKKAIKFFLECDLGKPEIKTVTDGTQSNIKALLSDSARRSSGGTSMPSTSSTKRRFCSSRDCLST